jgi:hypothetical protein
VLRSEGYAERPSLRDPQNVPTGAGESLAAQNLSVVGKDMWIRIERLSLIVTILGIPGLILAFLGLWRRPRVQVGFPPIREAR